MIKLDILCPLCEEHLYKVDYYRIFCNKICGEFYHYVTLAYLDEVYISLFIENVLYSFFIKNNNLIMRYPKFMQIGTFNKLDIKIFKSPDRVKKLLSLF